MSPQYRIGPDGNFVLIQQGKFEPVENPMEELKANEEPPPTNDTFNIEVDGGSIILTIEDPEPHA